MRARFVHRVAPVGKVSDGRQVVMQRRVRQRRQRRRVDVLVLREVGAGVGHRQRGHARRVDSLLFLPPVEKDGRDQETATTDFLSKMFPNTLLIYAFC